MNRHSQHPDTELLDRLRAGLLDDYPVQKGEVEAHLQGCEQCRQRCDWETKLQAAALQFPQLDERLQHARQRALHSPRRKALQRFVPLAAAAAVALVAVVVVNPLRQETPSETQVASTDKNEVPEVVEELDFYLWLADHKHIQDSST